MTDDGQATHVSLPPPPASCYPRKVPPPKEGEAEAVALLRRDRIIVELNERAEECVRQQETTREVYAGKGGAGR